MDRRFPVSALSRWSQERRDKIVLHLGRRYFALWIARGLRNCTPLPGSGLVAGGALGGVVT